MEGEQQPSKALLNILPNEAVWLARATRSGPELVTIAASGSVLCYPVSVTGKIHAVPVLLQFLTPKE